MVGYMVPNSSKCACRKEKKALQGASTVCKWLILFFKFCIAKLEACIAKLEACIAKLEACIAKLEACIAKLEACIKHFKRMQVIYKMEEELKSRYVDKIRGLMYGLLYKQEIHPQLKMVLDATVTGVFDIAGFARALKGGTDDDYINEVVASESYIEDPSISVHEVYEKYSMKEVDCFKLPQEEYDKYRPTEKIQIDNPITVLRAIPIGIFSKWEEYSVAASMVTHASHECILSSMLINCLIHAIMMEDIDSEKIAVAIEVVLQYGLNAKTISREIYDELRLFFENPLRRKVRSINGSTPEYTAFNVSNTAIAILQRYVDGGSSPDLFVFELDSANECIAEAENKNIILQVSAALMGAQCGFDKLVARFGENRTSELAKELINPFLANISLL